MRSTVRHVGMAFFVPFFFAYILGALEPHSLSAEAGVFTLLAFVGLGKVIGGGLGARARPREMGGAGRRLRSQRPRAMELVIAAIGLSIGILTKRPTRRSSDRCPDQLDAAPMLKICMDRADVVPVDPWDAPVPVPIGKETVS